MTESRTVECQDCGYRWESSAADPRCSKSTCGRSRNVEPVEDDLDDEPDEGDRDDEPEALDSQMDPADDLDDDLDDEQDADDDEGGFTAAFESVNQTADVEPSTPEPSTSTDEDDGDEQDADDEDSGSDGPDPAEDVPEIDPEQLAVAFDVTFDMAADRRGDHWALDDGEDMKLGKAWAPVLNTYAPTLFAEHTEVGIAVMCTFAVVAPKLAEDRELAELRKQQERAAQDGEPGEVREPDTGSTEWTPPTEEPDEQESQTPEWPDAEGDGANRQAATAGGYENV